MGPDKPPPPEHEPTPGGNRLLGLFVALALIAGGLYAIIGDDESESSRRDYGARLSRSEAFCSDLDDGLSLHQIYRSGNWDDAREFAEGAWGMMLVSCEDWLEDDSVRGFLREWGIRDP